MQNCQLLLVERVKRSIYGETDRTAGHSNFVCLRPWKRHSKIIFCDCRNLVSSKFFENYTKQFKLNNIEAWKPREGSGHPHFVFSATAAFVVVWKMKCDEMKKLGIKSH